MPLIPTNSHRFQQLEIRPHRDHYSPLPSTRKRFFRLCCALTLLFATVVVAKAANSGETPLIPFGISDGQTLRVVALNLGTNQTVKVTVKFLDADGNLLFQSPSTAVASGKMASFDYPRPSTTGEMGRIQIRPVVVNTGHFSTGCIHLTVEIFNDEDSKTTVLWDGPSVF
jgi:hypothetical protein